METTNKTEIINMNGMFMDFQGMAMEYVSKPDADEDTCFALRVICAMNKMERELFMEYLLENWKEYAMDIINGNYDYITITPIVCTAWENNM